MEVEKPFRKINQNSVDLEIANDKEENGWVKQLEMEIRADANSMLEGALGKLVDYYISKLRESEPLAKLIENKMALGWNQLAAGAELNTNIEDDIKLVLSLTFGGGGASGHYLVDYDLAGLLEYEMDLWDDSAIPPLEKLQETIAKIIAKLKEEAASGRK